MVEAIIVWCWARHVIQDIPQPPPGGQVIDGPEHRADLTSGDELLGDGGHHGGADGHHVVSESPRPPAMTRQVVIGVVGHVDRRGLIRRGRHPHQHRVVLSQGVDHCGQHRPGESLVTRRGNMASEMSL